MRNKMIGLLLSCSLTLCAQLPQDAPMASSSAKYDLSTLRSWEHIEKQGDLNKDGISDLVLISFPHFEELISVEDGDTINANKPVLTIFFGKTGGYMLWRQYENVLPHREMSFQFIDYGIDINDKGVLSFTFGYFSSMGSWENREERFVFRFQDNDFFLIGEDVDSFMRNSGKGLKTSINYLTKRKQEISYNLFEKKVKPKEKWSKIASAPLRLLGSWTMGDM